MEWVVHRDLKPANVMLTHDESDESSVKVLDFGIAKIVDRDLYLTRTGVPLGSPAYMSPEQVTVSDVDFRSDIYSLGCVIFECLEGHPPFKGESAIETMQKRLSEEVPLLSRYKPDSALGAGFNRLISKCMERTPEHRFQSMDDVREAISCIDTASGDEQSAMNEWTKSHTIETKLPRTSVVRGAILITVSLVMLIGIAVVALAGRFKAEPRNSLHY